MNSEELRNLLDKRKIQKITPSSSLARKTFRLALRDLKTSKDILAKGDYDWSLAIAYNAMLQAGRALMFLKGYRPSGEYKHLAVVEFLHAIFGKQLTDNMIIIFDRMRKKRHRIIYEEAEIVSEDEARQAVKWSEKFVKMVEKIVK